MTKNADFLVELFTEELPPKSLLKLASAFSQQLAEGLQKANLTFARTDYYASPRRLAVIVRDLIDAQADQVIERKGPALAQAFDANGNPSKACEGFARSCGITPAELITIKNDQGEWVGYKQQVLGKPVTALLPILVEQTVNALPIAKRMRWGNGDAQFVRPVHAVIMLYGDNVVKGSILGCEANRVTCGHRFHAPDWITIPTADAYASLLAAEGHVQADFSKRRAAILQQMAALMKDSGEQAVVSDELLDEVTGLVEWPVVLRGQFDKEFLQLPKEVLVSAMEDHQRYFPVVDVAGNMVNSFILVSNIMAQDAKRVIHGNERVLRARLSDAAFFFYDDQKQRLADRVDKLKGIVFQAKLGTLYEKTERLRALAAIIAKRVSADTDTAERAALLAKTDLLTNMVNEFPELQGTMGYYYALHDHETMDVAEALREQYLPRFAGDKLPENKIGKVLALADRLDTLVGAFGINQIPTGDKDPYALRRAALGVLRILIEHSMPLDLQDLLTQAVQLYKAPLQNKDTVAQVLNFIQERLRVYCQEQGISADVFAAVAALGITDPSDALQRMTAVKKFKQSAEASALSSANKRVSNILAKYTETLSAEKIDPALFEKGGAEEALAKKLAIRDELTMLLKSQRYENALSSLAGLRQPIDEFFDHVMVMVDDKRQRENRILLLREFRGLFLQVADIALLQD